MVHADERPAPLELASAGLSPLPDEPLVSIIVPVFNGRAYLKEALESATSQTYARTEVILIDDGSRDGSAELGERHPGVRVERLPRNVGVARARNVGVSKSGGSCLLFLDQDDVLVPRAVEHGVSALRARPECGYVFGRHDRILADGSVREAGVPQVADPSFRGQLSGHTLCPPSRSLFRREAVERVGGFDPALNPADDYALHLALARCFPVATHDAVVVQYRRHGANVTSLHVRRTLSAILRALDAQRPYLTTPELRAAYRDGQAHWRRLLGPRLRNELVARLRAGAYREAGAALAAMARHHPAGLATLLRRRGPAPAASG